MQSSISQISLSPYFFAQVKPNMVVLGFAGLPNKLHLTIAKSGTTSDVNLHITNENGAAQKPCIRVAIADTRKLEQAAQANALEWLFNLLEPIRLRPRPKRNRLGYRDRAYYIRLDDFAENPTFEVARKALKTWFWKNAKVKGGKKLKIQPQLIHSFKEYAWSPVVKDSFKRNFKPAFKTWISPVEYGLWCSEEYDGLVFVIQGQLYRFKENMNPADLLSIWADESVIKALTDKYQSALDEVAKAVDYEDTRQADRPVRLC